MSGFKKIGFSQSLLGAASVVGMLSFAQVAVAQDTVATTQGEALADEDSTKTLDTVVVTGFRQSLKSALTSKRNAQTIVDGITAEDIGKSSDKNIAEALQRVTGVSINRANGEGTTVSVRGVNADLNNVTVNGVTLTSSGGDLSNGEGNQRVDFSAFSADILSRIEVAKTPSADHDEGSLGAAINLSTFKPLDARKDRRILSVEGTYNDQADTDLSLHDLDDNGRLSLSVSEKFLDDKLGVSLVAVKEKNTTRTDIDEVTRYFVYTPGSAVGAAGGLVGGATNVLTDELITAPSGPVLFDFGDGLGEVPLSVHAPFEKQYQIHSNEVNRSSFTGALQFKPTDFTDIQFDGTYTETQREQNQFQYRIRPWGGTRTGDTSLFNPETRDLVGYRRTALFDTRGSGHTNPGFVRPAENQRDTTDKNIVLSLDAEHEWNEFVFTLRGGTSRTTSRDDKVFNTTYQIENQPDNNGNRPGSLNGFLRDENGIVRDTGHAGFYSGYLCSNNSFSGVCPIVVSAEDVANYDESVLGPIVDNTDIYTFGSLNVRDRAVDDKSASVFFDVDWNHSFGPISSFETGFKWSTRNRNQRQTNINQSRFQGESQALFGIKLTEFHNGAFSPSDFGEELGLARDAITDGIPLPDADLLFARLAELDAVPRVLNNPANQREFNLDVLGGYLKANINAFDGRLFGDIGLRYVETEVTAEQGGGIILQTANFTEDERNVLFFGSEAAAEAALGRDLLSVGEPGYREASGIQIVGEHKYENVLPSLNLNYQATDDIIVRFAASKTMARAPFDDLRPGFNFQESVFNPATDLSLGNPKLDPFESTNLDLSFEWYFDEESLFSVALFDKQLDSFSRGLNSVGFFADPRPFLYDANGVALENPTNVPGLEGLLLPFSDAQPANCLPNREFDYSALNGEAGCELVNVNSLENGQGGYVRGLELGFQHNLTYLPGLLSGTGFVLNYTYSDSETDQNVVVDPETGTVTSLSRAMPLANTSEHTFNATMFYEQDGKQIRLAYNTRTDYLINDSQTGGYAVFAEGGESLDLSGGIDITDRITLNFSAVNLTDDVYRTYAVVNDGAFLTGDALLSTYSPTNSTPREEVSLGDQPTHRTLRRSNTGRIFRVGLRYEF